MLRLCGNRWAPIYLLSGCTLARHVLAFMIMGVDGYCSYSALVSYAVVICILSSLSVGYWPFDFRFHAFSLLVVIQAVIRCFTGFFCDMLYSVSPFVCCEWYLTLRLGDWRVRDFLLRTDTLSPTRLVMHWRFIRMIAFFVDECDLVLSGCTFCITLLPRSHITASQTLKLYWLGLLLRFRAGVSAPCAVTPSSTTPTKKSFR